MKRLGFIILASLTFWSLNAHAQAITQDTTMSIKWSYTSAGNNCSGYPAKIGAIYGVASATPFSPPTGTCCPWPGDMYSCTSAGGSTPGTADPGACAGGATPTPAPGNDYFAFYENTSGGCGGLGCSDGLINYSSSTYNGASYGYTEYLKAGETLSTLRAVVGFISGQGTTCSPSPMGYCYNGHVHTLNFSTATADCGKWITTSVGDCGFSSLQISVMMMPTSGSCPSAGTPTPTPSPTATPTPTPTPTVAPTTPTPSSGVYFDPQGYAFGNVTAKSSSAALSVKITNYTGTTLSSCVLTTSETADFTLTGASGCSSLTAGSYCLVNLTGTPQSVGAFSTQLVLTCGP